LGSFVHAELILTSQGGSSQRWTDCPRHLLVDPFLFPAAAKGGERYRCGV